MHTLFTITAHQIGRLRGVSYKTARKEWHAVRDALQLEKDEPLKLRDLAAYWDLPCADLASTLYKIKNN
jgi:hypothetical protein